MKSLADFIQHYGYDKTNPPMGQSQRPFNFNPDTLAYGLFSEPLLASDYNGIHEWVSQLSFSMAQEMLAVLFQAGVTPDGNFPDPTDETTLKNSSQFLQALPLVVQGLLKVNSGQVRLNSYGANLKPNWTSGTLGATPVQISYGALGVQETLNFSAVPTSKPPLNWAGVIDPVLFYDYTTGQFLENQVLGQKHSWRLIFSYTKAINSNPIIEVQISNPASSFITSQYRQLPNAKSSGDFDINFITFADPDSLVPPLGTGGGYKFEISNVNNGNFTSLILENFSTIYQSDQDLYLVA